MEKFIGDNRQKNLEDLRPWSNFDNTCLHPKVICNVQKFKIFFLR